jgi:hypothetical protein
VSVGHCDCGGCNVGDLVAMDVRMGRRWVVAQESIHCRRVVDRRNSSVGMTWEAHKNSSMFVNCRGQD